MSRRWLSDHIGILGSGAPARTGGSFESIDGEIHPAISPDDEVSEVRGMLDTAEGMCW